jgi:glycosyltransferase involved in cell wall biosynthesis
VNLAFVSPLPPQRTGIADYSAALLPYLRPHFGRIIAVTDQSEPILGPGVVDDVIDLSALRDALSDGRTVPVYHIGCSTKYHGRILDACSRWPGFVVLHDGHLLPMIHDLTVGGRDLAAFRREAAFERAEGLEQGWHALWGGRPLSDSDFSMVGRIGRSSLGVIVHSQCLARRVRRSAPSARVAVIPHLDLVPADRPPLSRDVLRSRLGLDPDHLLVGAVGIIAPSKRLELLLDAFSCLRQAYPHARVLCIGDTAPNYEFDRAVDRRRLGGSVTVTGYVRASALNDYIGALDVAFNLRHPTWGESSGALIRLMSCGIPTLVSDAGAYAELPDTAVCKVPSEAEPLVEVEKALRDLLARKRYRQQVGQAARTYVKTTCNPQRVANRYASFIEEAVGNGLGTVRVGSFARRSVVCAR